MQKTGDQCIWYTYDESGNLSGLRVGNSEYYYYRNGQGDIIGIIDSTGSIAAKYSYDAWGTPIAITDGAGNDVSGNVSHIANINPFGLNRVVRNGTKNGMIISWMEPVSNIEVFRWDQNPNFKNGAHYHVYGQGHYYGGDLVPEPLGTIYFHR